MERKIILRKIEHNGSTRLALYFDYDSELISICKSIGAKFSKSKKCWYIDDRPRALDLLFKAFRNKAWLDGDAIFKKKQVSKTEKKTKAPLLKDLVPEAFKAILIRRKYSNSTFRTYCSFLNKFANYISPVELDQAGKEEVNQFLYHLQSVPKVSTSTQNQAINAIKFYFEKVLERERTNFFIERPRKEKSLPKVLSEEQVVKLILASDNLKHQCIIALLYSSGLRRGELLNLRPDDIWYDRFQVYIRKGKGKKDRATVLSERMAIALRKYTSEYKPRYWLFEGSKGGKYSGTSVGRIVSNASEKAGLTGVTPHILRHSFATHMMDRGVDTRVIQVLLGHERLETTAIYTHVSKKDFRKIKSPLDQIFGHKELNNNTLNNPPT